MSLESLRDLSPPPVLKVADDVWERRDTFLRWPTRALLLMPGTCRTAYHQYSDELKARIREGGLRPDSRSNGPAIVAYRLAGGERPARVASGRDWTIHHIYDGQFPWPGRGAVTHAVKDGRYFTEAAGLVAAHPVADALADDVPWFAWMLRREAFLRFAFDPDQVFTDKGAVGILP
jgi:hypothetical protein